MAHGALIAALTVAAALGTTGCGGSGDGAVTAPQTSGSSSAAAALAVVAIGDSDASGVGDTTGRGWVGRYGALLQDRLGETVTVDNRAGEGTTSDQLLNDVSNDEAMRKALGKADVVLIGIGGADLNAGDDALAAGSCKGRRCYSTILQAFDRNIAAIASEVRRVAPDALLRAISLPNVVPGAGDAIPPFITADIGRYQTLAERASVCRALQSNGGQCVDTLRAFNGAKDDADAYATGLLTKDPCCYPSDKGQQLMAQLLVASGLPPGAQ